MKLYSVQYLRGLAALLVVIAHSAAHPVPNPTIEEARLGQFGVALFFVISGFIMVAISGPGPIDPLAFLKRRIVRIVPLYWLFTTLAAALALFLPALFETTVFTWPHYIQSLLFLPHEAPVRGGTSPLLSLGWTLNYEAFFYLAFALCAALAATRRVVVLTLVFGVLAVIGVVARPLQPALGFYATQELLAFCAGAWIALLFMKGRIGAIPPVLLPIAGAAGLTYAFVLDRAPQDSLLSFIAVVTVSSALLVGGLQRESRLPRLRLLEAMGDASYSTYLVHMFVVGAARAIFEKVMPHAGVAIFVGAVAVVVVVSLTAGFYVHVLIEKPMLALFRGPVLVNAVVPVEATNSIA